MKKSLILFATGLLATAGVINAETATATATATIVPNLEISEDTAFSFGKISPGTTESYIEISASLGASVNSGNATLRGGHSMGAFTLTGDANRPLGTISVTANGTLTDGTNTLNTSYSIHDNGTSIPTALDSSGKATFDVVGFITVPANTPAANYTGTYEITYSY